MKISVGVPFIFLVSVSVNFVVGVSRFVLRACVPRRVCASLQYLLGRGRRNKTQNSYKHLTANILQHFYYWCRANISVVLSPG